MLTSTGKKIAGMLLVMLLFTMFAGVTPASAATTVTVNPNYVYVDNWEGWGTSLCWWANVIGGWPNRDAIIDEFYGAPSSTCLGMNIARYNIGGGDNPTHNHMLYGYDLTGFEPSSGTWDWNADANQRYVLQRAKNNVPNLITEAFSNSPPYWMTNSGCASGAATGTDGNNLPSTNFNAFADYLTEVVKHFRDYWGITFDYLAPINEPWGSTWRANGAQEGCNIDHTLQRGLLSTVNTYLSNKELTATKLTAPDECNSNTALDTINSYDSSTMSLFTKINTHAYGSNNNTRSSLHNVAVSKGKKLWMDEWCTPFCPYDSNHVALDAAVSLAGGIIDDMRVLKPSAWIEWQAVASLEEISSWNEQKNLLNAYFDPSNNPNNVYYTTKSYYSFGQFSKFIRPGYKIIDSSDSNSVVAWDPSSGNLVIVVNNSGTGNIDYTYDLSAFSSVGSATTTYRTSATESWSQLSNISISNKSFTATANAKSTTTYVIPNCAYSGPNVALNKTASADSAQTSTPASYGNDGNLSTRWCADDGNMNHWWKVDLGANYDITGSQLTFETTATNQYKIETSTDNTNWTLATDQTGRTSTSQTQADNWTATARYVRVTITNSGNWCGFYECKVYGSANVALNKTASADSAQTGNPASKGNDGNMSTRWCSTDGNMNHWWKVDLGANYDITGSQLTFETTATNQYKIETSTDNTNWTLATDQTGRTSTSQTQADNWTATARYVRVTITNSGNWCGFYECKVYGSANVALNKTASADSAETGNPASKGNDGNMSTRWCAADGNMNHWWKTDLGANYDITGSQLTFEVTGINQYKIETSTDNINWTLATDQTGRFSTSQTQTDNWTATARYVRVTITNSGNWCGFYECKVYGQ